MKKLPDGWDFVQLNKVADIIRGVSYDGSDSEKEDGEGYASILRAGNIGSSITYDDLVYVPERYVSQEQYLKAGDILIATSSGSKHIVGKAAQIKNNRKISFGAFCCVIRPKKVDPEYLNSYFQSKHYKSFVQKTLRGANINNLRISQIRSLEIPLPPLPTQKKIAAVLGKAEKLREWRKEADWLTDELLKSTFLEMFGDPVENPKGWEFVQLKSVYSNLKSGTKCGPFGSALKKNEYVNSGVPVWTMDNIYENRFIDEGYLFITTEKYKQLESYIVEKGDILISRAGTVGKMCVANPSINPSIISTNLIRLSLDSSKIKPIFFTCLMTYCKGKIGRLEAGEDGAYTFMNTGILNELQIPLPPLPLQQKFASIVQQVEQIREHQTQSRQHIENFFNVLMQKAFSGNWRQNKCLPLHYIKIQEII